MKNGQGERFPLRALLGFAALLSACSASGGDATELPLELLPREAFEAVGSEGGPFSTSSIYFLRNAGPTELAWIASSSASWLSASDLSGTIAPGEAEELLVLVEEGPASALTPGFHQAELTFTFGASSVQLVAELEVEGVEEEALAANPAELALGGPKGGPMDPGSASVQLTNPGSQSLAWSASGDVAWLNLTPSSGTLPAGGSQSLTVSAGSGANALATGPHEGRFTFRAAGGGPALAEVEVTLGIGTFIEQQAWLNVHGRPFFPIGVWNQPPWSGHADYLKSLGINTYLNNGLTPPEPTNAQLLDLVEEKDMWAILQFDAAVKDHPRLLGWLLEDEPDLYGTPAATVQAAYDAIRAVDTEHFIGLNTTGGFYWDSNFGSPSVESQYQAYTDIPDIASFDMYPVTGWNRADWVYMPGAMTESLLTRYVERTKPVWAIIEASDQNLSWVPPETPGPSSAQMRFQVWDAVIHGATAIHYFTIAFDPFEWANLTPTIEQELLRTNTQLTELADVILSPPPAIAVTTSELNGYAHNYMLRRRGTTYYLFADNADMGYRSATLTFTFPVPLSSVTVLGEGRTVTPTGNSFTDTFAPLGVHIYELRP